MALVIIFCPRNRQSHGVVNCYYLNVNENLTYQRILVPLRVIILQGMGHLEEIGIVHRNLGARNVLGKFFFSQNMVNNFGFIIFTVRY